MLALISGAWAATTVVVVHGATGPAVASVAARTGIPLEDLAAVDLAAVAVPGLRGAEAIPCAGPPVDGAGFRVALAEVVGRFDAGDLGEARALARALEASTACLTDPVDPSEAWSTWFVEGVVAFASGAEDEARADWTRARALDPQRPWDDDFAPGDALTVFATALPGAAVPFRSIGGPFRIDGIAAGPTVAPGRHLVQAGARTWLADLDRPVIAVAPDLDPSVLASDPDDLAALLAAALPGERAVYLVDGDDVARLDLVAATSRPILAPPTAPVEAHQRPWGAVVVGVGGAVLATGLVDLALTWPAARQANADGRAAPDGPSWKAARADWDAAHTRWELGYGAIGVGGAAAVAGSIELLARSARGDQNDPPPVPVVTPDGHQSDGTSR